MFEFIVVVAKTVATVPRQFQCHVGTNSHRRQRITHFVAYRSWRNLEYVALHQLHRALQFPKALAASDRNLVYVEHSRNHLARHETEHREYRECNEHFEQREAERTAHELSTAR